MTPSTFAVIEGFDSHASRKKRLGQYFSGLRVSRLLMALAARRGIQSVCDPMGGRGDMLVAAREVIHGCRQTDGIEIDAIAHGEGISALSAGSAEYTYLLGSAFDAATISRLRMGGYDLVATNPPYVRYQAQKVAAGQVSMLPGALEVRNGLRECLAHLATLSEDDKRAFATIAEGYSGLSDLAVPSWILCAGLVKPGGTLAMVVPEAWLNRDYANVIRYLLLRWFRIEFVVEDAHAAWFTDAQVKTNLLVARRINRGASINGWTDQTYLHVTLPGNLANANSLVGRSNLGHTKGAELALARTARRVANGSADVLVDGATWHCIRIADQAAVVTGAAQHETWFRQLEPCAQPIKLAGCAIPPILVPWFAGYDRLTTLDHLGVAIGQGLRTGANGFFYADLVARHGAKVSVASELFAGEHVELPAACVLPVVRKQADVADTMSVDLSRLRGVALAFHGWALPEDATAAAAQKLPATTARYIRRATHAKVDGKLLPALTAVAPNARKANTKTGAPRRYWYMLPNFAPRHRPDVFVARVNAETPRVVLNPGRTALVDANFATLWIEAGASIEASAIFAYLKSSLAAALFEHIGAVMGGGALKLEATHLRALPVPTLSARVWARLGAMGRCLAAATVPDQQDALVQRIDRIVCRAMFGADGCAAKVMALRATIRDKQTARAKRT